MGASLGRLTSAYSVKRRNNTGITVSMLPSKATAKQGPDQRSQKPFSSQVTGGPDSQNKNKPTTKKVNFAHLHGLKYPTGKYRKKL